jgi:hypothetical protein
MTITSRTAVWPASRCDHPLSHLRLTPHPYRHICGICGQSLTSRQLGINPQTWNERTGTRSKSMGVAQLEAAETCRVGDMINLSFSDVTLRQAFCPATSAYWLSKGADQIR